MHQGKSEQFITELFAITIEFKETFISGEKPLQPFAQQLGQFPRKRPFPLEMSPEKKDKEKELSALYSTIQMLEKHTPLSERVEAVFLSGT